MLNDWRFLTSAFAERRGQKDKNCPSTKHSLSLSFLWCCWGSVRLHGHSKSSPGAWAQSHLYSRLLLHNYWGSASPVPRAGPRYPLERRHGELSPMHSNGTVDLFACTMEESRWFLSASSRVGVSRQILQLMGRAHNPLAECLVYRRSHSKINK